MQLVVNMFQAARMVYAHAQQHVVACIYICNNNNIKYRYIMQKKCYVSASVWCIRVMGDKGSRPGLVAQVT